MRSRQAPVPSPAALITSRLFSVAVWFEEGGAATAEGVALTTKGGRNMGKWLAKAGRFLREEDGPTAVEYAVMLALIIVVCIAAISLLGSNAQGTFSNVA